MGFAERNGFVEAKAIQIDDIDIGLRNRLYNAVHTYCEPSPFIDKELSFRSKNFFQFQSKIYFFS